MPSVSGLQARQESISTKRFLPPWDRHGLQPLYASGWLFSWQGLLIYDISNPAVPVAVGALEFPGWDLFDLDVLGSHVYVADGDNGVRVIDVSEPAQPRLATTLDTLSPRDITIANGYAYVLGYGELTVLDLSHPEAPVEVSTTRHPMMHGGGIAIDGSTAYVAAGRYGGLRIFDLSGPFHPTYIGTVETPDGAVEVVVANQVITMAWGGWRGLHFSPKQCVATPILLTDLALRIVDDTVQVLWRVPEPGAFQRFFVQRSESNTNTRIYVTLNEDLPTPATGPWEYLDEDTQPGKTYCYRLQGLLNDGGSLYSESVCTSVSPLPFRLSPTSPNPTVGLTRTRFSLASRSQVELKIFDVRGRRCAFC